MTTAAGLDGVIAAAKTRRRAAACRRCICGIPAHCGEIDIVIRKDGLWFHEGTPIGREALVRLFSTVLRKDPDGFHLVTPVEKMKITVEDAPFIAVRVDREGEALQFLTNVGDEVEAGPDNAIRVEMDAGDRRAAALSACAPRPGGADRAAGVLRAGGDGRGARDAARGRRLGVELQRRLVPGRARPGRTGCERRRAARTSCATGSPSHLDPLDDARPRRRGAVRSDFDLEPGPWPPTSRSR